MSCSGGEVERTNNQLVICILHNFMMKLLNFLTQRVRPGRKVQSFKKWSKFPYLVHQISRSSHSSPPSSEVWGRGRIIENWEFCTAGIREFSRILTFLLEMCNIPIMNVSKRCHNSIYSVSAWRCWDTDNPRPDEWLSLWLCWDATNIVWLENCQMKVFLSDWMAEYINN